jgi:uncharacterized protein (TIGR03435 family)
MAATTADFEVASVRVHTAHGGRVSLSTSVSRLTAEAKTLPGLVMYAYNLQSYQVPYTSALKPFGDLFYDIAAKAPGDVIPSLSDFRKMLSSF